MAKLRVGIVGCGGIANGKHFPGLTKNNDLCEIVAVCDLIEERAVETAKRFGLSGVKITTDYMDIANDPDIDVVHVLTPNREHSFITVAMLEHGKHVMCEKPMAINPAEAKKMLDAAEKSGKKLTIGYQHRQFPETQRLKNLIQKDALGEIYYAKAISLRRRGIPTWGVFMNKEEQGGGTLIDIETHALDLTLWLMDNYEPEMVVGTTYQKLGNQPGLANPWGPFDHNAFTVEDAGFGMVRMKNGATIMLESSWALNLTDVPFGTVLCGTKGGATYLDEKLEINGEEDGGLYTKNFSKMGGVAFYEGLSDDQVYNEQRQWLLALQNGKDPCVLPKQAYVVSQILEAVYESGRTGKPVYFD